MHRLLAICLLLLMPLQGSWAVPAVADLHEGGCVTLQADAIACANCDRTDTGATGAPAATPADGVGCGADCDPDCAQCQAPALNALLGLPTTAPISANEATIGDCAGPVGSHIPDPLLRPPLQNRA